MQPTGAAAAEVAHRLAHIAQDRAGGGQAARAAAAEHEVAGRVPVDEDRVEGVVDRCERMAEGEEHRVDPRLDPGGGAAGQGDQLDAAAHLLGIGDVLGRQARNALGVDVEEDDPRIEADRG